MWKPESAILLKEEWKPEGAIPLETKPKKTGLIGEALLSVEPVRSRRLTSNGVEPTAEDLEKYRRMGVKEYRSPAGEPYDLTKPSKVVAPQIPFSPGGAGFGVPVTGAIKAEARKEPSALSRKAKEITGGIGALFDPTVYKAAKLYVTDKSPYRKDRYYKGEVYDRFKNMVTRALSPLAYLMPGVTRKNLIEELNKEAEQFTGFGPAVVPATGEVAEFAAEWIAFIKAFGAVHTGVETVKDVPKVAKLLDAIEKSGGVKKFAARFPRIFSATQRGLQAFLEGEIVGQTYGALEGVEEGDILKRMNIRGATVGTIAAGFSVASSIDNAVYARKLRNILTQNTKARYDPQIKVARRNITKLGAPAKGQKKLNVLRKQAAAKLYNLTQLEKLELQQIDNIVSATEAQLIGMKSGKLARGAFEGVESPQKAAQRIIKYGYKPNKGYTVGQPELKTGMGKAPKRPLMPTSKVKEYLGEIRQVAKQTAQEIRGVKGVRRIKAPKPPTRMVEKPPVAEIRGVKPKKGIRVPPRPTEAITEVEGAPPAMRPYEIKLTKADLKTTKGSVFHGTMPANILNILEKGQITPQISKGDKLGQSVVSMTKYKAAADNFGVVTLEVKDKDYTERPGAVEGDWIEGLEVISNKSIPLSDIKKAHITLGAKEDLSWVDRDTGKSLQEIKTALEEKGIPVQVYKIKPAEPAPRPTEAPVKPAVEAKVEIFDTPAAEQVRLKAQKLADKTDKRIGLYYGRDKKFHIFSTLNPPKGVTEYESITPSIMGKAPPAKPAKEFEIEPGKFYTQAKIDEAITKGEIGEIEIEPVLETESKSFNKHIDYFQKRQLPETSQIRKIQKQMQIVNGQRLAGTITAKEANKKIQQLRKLLFETAEKEGIALRMTKGGKVSVAVRKAGTYVPVEFAEYKRFQDIYPRAQDVTRSIQQIDGALSVKQKKKMPGQAGAAERNVLWPTREMQKQKLEYLKEKALVIEKMLPGKETSKEYEQAVLVLEKISKADRNKPIKDVLSAKTIKAMGVNPSIVKQAVKAREYLDNLIEEQNTARTIRDADLIPYRHNYSPHILRDATMWEKLSMIGKTAEDVFGKKAPIPDYIRPNKPFNPREMARKGGMPYEERIKSLKALLRMYTATAAKDIFNTSIIQNNKAFIQQLEAMGYENPARYLADWTSQAYAGIMPSLDRALLLGETPKARKGMMKWNQVRNLAVFPLNVGWTLGTQVKSLAMTFGRYGAPNVVRGFGQWLKPSIRRQAAEDYYSFIVKSAKQGRVTRQDAKNLIGEEVKLRRTKPEMLRDLTTLFLEEMEKLLTGTSIRAAHLHGKKRGLTGEALKNYASDGGAKTQSMYNDEDKPLFLTNLTVKTVTPYQTYCYETMNILREWAGRTGTPPDSKMYAIWSLVRYLAAMAVLNQIEASVRGRKWSWLRLVPMPFSELWLSPIYKHFTKEWLPGGSGLLSPVETASRVAKGVDDVLETGSWRKLRNELIKYGPGLFSVPGGVQWARLVDAIITYSQGGVYDRRGKLLFKMKDPQDLARAIFTGVWTTKGGREYIEKRTGKKQEGTRKKRLEREKRMLRK